MTAAQLTLPLVQRAQATPRQAELLDRGRRAAQGLLPNMYRAMANNPALLEAYLVGYGALRAESGLTPAELEVVFLVISRENACDYCVAAHSLMADALSRVPREVTDAIRAGARPADERLAALAEVTRALLLQRGRPDEQVVRRFLDAGYDECQLLAVVAAIGVKTLSNYTNHLFQTPLDDVFKARELSTIQTPQRAVEPCSPR